MRRLLRAIPLVWQAIPLAWRRLWQAARLARRRVLQPARGGYRYLRIGFSRLGGTLRLSRRGLLGVVRHAGG